MTTDEAASWQDFRSSSDWRIYSKGGFLRGGYTVTGPDARGNPEVKAWRSTLWGARRTLRRLRRKGPEPRFWELPIVHREP